MNTGGTENIALVCKTMDIKMMYISTDYVFNGHGKKLGNQITKIIPL